MNARSWSLTRTLRRLHTRAGLILMPPRHVHTSCKFIAWHMNTQLCWMCFKEWLSCTCLCSTCVISITEGLFWGKTDDYGATLCDTRVLRVTRGVKQAGRAQTSLLLALRLLLHGWCPQGQGSEHVDSSSPISHPFVCSVGARAFPFMHTLTIHAHDKEGSKKQVETRERRSQIYKNLEKWNTKTLLGVTLDGRIHSAKFPGICYCLSITFLITSPLSNSLFCPHYMSRWQMLSGVTRWKLQPAGHSTKLPTCLIILFVE